MIGLMAMVIGMTLATFWDYPANNAPVDYDYGNNITYQGDTVYYGSQPSATAADYYTQAQIIAQSAPIATAQLRRQQTARQLYSSGTSGC
jgi:hypothetical protein